MNNIKAGTSGRRHLAVALRDVVIGVVAGIILRNVYPPRHLIRWDAAPLTVGSERPGHGGAHMHLVLPQPN